MSDAPPSAAANVPVGGGVRAASWVVYDLANTIYAAAVTYLFTPYFTDRFDGEIDTRTSIGIVTTASMLLAGLMSPLLGAIADRTGRARTYLALGTLLNVAMMLVWGLGGSATALLAALFVANVAYQAALTFYNALLPSVAATGREGWLSGIGTGVGYFGNIVVLVALVAVPPASFAEAPSYLAFGGVAFLGFALPCMLLVADTRAVGHGPLGAAVRTSWRDLGRSLRELPRHRPLWWFLLGNFCVVDVLNTAIQFFGDYVKDAFAEPYAAGTLRWFGMEFGPDAGSMVGFLGMLGLVFSGLAFVFALAIARWTDRHALGVLRVSALGLAVALLGGAWFGGGDTTLFTLTLVVGGALGMAGVWTAGRKLLLQLVPRERAGEFFGLYGITVKVSVLGSVLYGVLADHLGSRTALLAQCVPLLLGMVCLAMVRIPPDRAAPPPR